MQCKHIKVIILLIIFAYIFIPSVNSFAISAYDEALIQKYEDYEFIVDSDGKAIIIKYNGNNKELTVPNNFNGTKVKTIGEHSFYGNSNLKSIRIPNNISKIGKESFANCENLSSVFMPYSLKEIGDSAFFKCSNLSSIKIPPQVVSIGKFAFASCDKLSSIIIPDSVNFIAKDAFYKSINLTATIIAGSYSDEYCKQNNIQSLYSEDCD